MNIVKSPQTVTPVYNPIIYQFGTTFSNTLYFDIKIYDTSDNSLIITDKAYVTPINVSGAEYNFNDVAKTLVNWEIKNNNVVWQGLTNNTFNLQLKASEVGLVGNTMSTLGATLSATPIKVFRGGFTRLEWTDWDMNDWYLTGSNVIGFLSRKPNYYSVNDISREWLYFLKDTSYFPTLKITKYLTGSPIGSTTSTITSTQSSVRLDVSPKVLNATFTNFLVGSDQYSITLMNGGATVSETKYYTYEETDCNLEYVNILWENDRGGIDSYQFINPLPNREVERFIIESNPYKYDTSMEWTDIRDGIYNQTERIVGYNLAQTWTMWTKWLTTDENIWLADLLHSKNIWVELKGGRILPVTLQETTYTINKQKWQRLDPLQSQWTFKVGESIDESMIFADSIGTTTTTTSTTTTTTTLLATTTTTSTTTTTTTLGITGGTGATGGTGGTGATGLAGEIYIDTSTLVDFEITDVKVNGVSVEYFNGTDFPVNNASGLFHHYQFGTYSIDIYYGSHTTGVNLSTIGNTTLINYCIDNTGSLNPAGGSWSVVYDTNVDWAVVITAASGDCA